MTKDISMPMRIKTLVDFFANGNNSKFAKIIGTSEANIRNYINGGSPKVDTIISIVTNFEISCEWLIMGKGEMFTKPEENIENTSNYKCPICKEKDKLISNQSERINELKETISILKSNTSTKRSSA